MNTKAKISKRGNAPNKTKTHHVTLALLRQKIKTAGSAYYVNNCD